MSVLRRRLAAAEDLNRTGTPRDLVAALSAPDPQRGWAEAWQRLSEPQRRQLVAYLSTLEEPSE